MNCKIGCGNKYFSLVQLVVFTSTQKGKFTGDAIVLVNEGVSASWSGGLF